jgi:hypothetical protein
MLVQPHCPPPCRPSASMSSGVIGQQLLQRARVQENEGWGKREEDQLLDPERHGAYCAPAPAIAGSRTASPPSVFAPPRPAMRDYIRTHFILLPMGLEKGSAALN